MIAKHIFYNTIKVVIYSLLIVVTLVRLTILVSNDIDIANEMKNVDKDSLARILLRVQANDFHKALLNELKFCYYLVGFGWILSLVFFSYLLHEAFISIIFYNQILLEKKFNPGMKKINPGMKPWILVIFVYIMDMF